MSIFNMRKRYNLADSGPLYGNAPEHSVASGWGYDFDNWLTGGAVEDYQNRTRKAIIEDAIANSSLSEDNQALQVLQNLNDDQLIALLSQYEDKVNSGSPLQRLNGYAYHKVNYDALLRDINALTDFPEFTYKEPGELREAAAERANQEAQEQLGLLKSQYNTLSSNLLSKDYQNSMRNVDTLNSQMNRARQNALTAGASAGLRIASNVNTLLSNQNKQSQQSLDTANQLSQMLLNQRSAAQSIYNNKFDKENAYLDRYTSDYNADRDSYEDRLNREFSENSVATVVNGQLDRNAHNKSYDEYNKSNNQTSQSNYN